MTKKQSKRGRPAQLSRDQIMQCALKLLEQEPAEVTISAVARALNCAPMTLYSHVANRDDLLQGVSDIVLGQLTITEDQNQSWQQGISDWMFEVREQLLRYPQVVKLLREAEMLPPQWLRVHAILIRCLQRAGLKGEALAQCLRWLAQLVVNDVLINANARPEGALINGAMASLDAGDQATFESVLPLLADTEQGLFEFVVAQAIASVEALAK